MNTNEIIEYVMHGAAWLALGASSYVIAIMGSQRVSLFFSEKITTQKDLEKIIEEESTKLKLNKSVTGVLCTENKAKSVLTKKGEYVILTGGIGARRAAVRHELYHIYKGDCDQKNYSALHAKLRYAFCEEPRATIYQIFGVKL